METAARVSSVEGVEVLDERFAESVAPHIPRMARLAARLCPIGDAEDVVQEALARAWVKWRQYDPSRGSLAGWLLAITADQARRLRRGPRRAAVFIEPGSPRQVEDAVDLEAAIERLSERQRLAVDCYYFAGLSVSEVAAVMRCSEGTVKSTLSDARALLRLRLER